jgi:hypothetical protein
VKTASTCAETGPAEEPVIEYLGSTWAAGSLAKVTGAELEESFGVGGAGR